MSVKIKFICVVFLLILLLVPVGADKTEYIVQNDEDLEESYEIKEKYNINGNQYYVFTINNSNKENQGEVSSLTDSENIFRNKVVTPHSANKRLTTNKSFNFNIKSIKAEKIPPKSEYRNINIAVLDTGISKHDNLNSVKWEHNVMEENRTVDNFGHGTHVAGIIAADYNKTTDIRGVAPGIDIYDIKVIDDEGFGSLTDLAIGIRRAAEGPDGIRGTKDDADIISMSLGFESDSLIVKDMLEEVHPDIITVASAGNSGKIEYPAKYKETISVANIHHNELIPGPVNGVGEENTVAAPGYTVKSLSNDNSYSIKTGTSMSAPHVSGALGIYLSDYNTDAETAEKVLEKTATDVLDRGFDKATGHGLLNVKSLLNTPPKPKIKSISTKERNDKIEISFNATTFGTNTDFFISVSEKERELNKTKTKKIECCKFNINKSTLNTTNKNNIFIKLESKNKWGKKSEIITYNIKKEEKVLKAIKQAGDNPNKIERKSLQDAIFKFVEGEKRFNGTKLTREGIENAVFKFAKT